MTYWILVIVVLSAYNSQTSATSVPGFTSQQLCQKAADDIVRHAPDETRILAKCEEQ